MAPTTYPPYLREKARELRRERKLTIDQLAECLALPRTTIYYWVRDLPIPRTRQTSGQRKGARGMRRKYRELREAAYEDGLSSFRDLCARPTFREFVTLYMAEGYKRCRNVVSLGNSDPAIVRVATNWIRLLATNKLFFSLQYHADQDVDELRRFWSTHIGVEPHAIRLQRKANSNQLKGRTWRSRYGFLTVGSNDTYLHARLQAWMKCIRDDWLHSAVAGV